MKLQSCQEDMNLHSDSGKCKAYDDVEAEMRRLKLELKQTMDMYSTACKEALNAKQKAKGLHHWKLEEERKLEVERLAKEAALALVEMEKAKCKAAIEAAEASQRIAELEAQKRLEAEKKALKEAEEKKKVLDALNRLRALAEDNMPDIMLGSSAAASPKDNHVSTIQDAMNDPQLLQNWEWI